MEIDVYRASIRPQPQETLYVLIHKGKKPEEELPAEEVEQLGSLDHVKTINLERGQKRISLNTEEALREIEEHGYYVQSTSFVIRFTR